MRSRPLVCSDRGQLVVALAGAAHSLEPIEDLTFLPLALSSGSRSKPTDPNGSVAAIASKAAAVMVMRIMRVQYRRFAAPSRGEGD